MEFCGPWKACRGLADSLPQGPVCSHRGQRGRWVVTGDSQHTHISGPTSRASGHRKGMKKPLHRGRPSPGLRGTGQRHPSATPHPVPRQPPELAQESRGTQALYQGAGTASNPARLAWALPGPLLTHRGGGVRQVPTHSTCVGGRALDASRSPSWYSRRRAPTSACRVQGRHREDMSCVCVGDRAAGTGGNQSACERHGGCRCHEGYLRVKRGTISEDQINSLETFFETYFTINDKILYGVITPKVRDI